MTESPEGRRPEDPSHDPGGGTPPPPPPGAGGAPPGGGYQPPPVGGYQPPPPSGAYQPPPEQAGYQGPPPWSGQPGQQGAPVGYGSPYPASPQGARPGELIDRAVARLVDYVLLAIVNAVLIGTVIVGTVLGMRSGTLGLGGGEYAATAITSILGTAIYVGYFTWMESSRGQTLGKMLMKLRVQGPAGGDPTVEAALRRNLFNALNLIGLIPLIGWLLAPLAQLAAVIAIAVGINNDTARRQGWHDHFAGGTTVVKIG
jgi:uncharacterized RDD family membrane protein YckC